MVPAFLGVALWARFARARERDVVRRQLPAMVYYRWITPSEAGWLGSIAARRKWEKAVRARSGKAGVAALRAFQTAATELAFLRDRVERGTGPADAWYLHAELLDALGRNRALAQEPLRQLRPAVAPVRPRPPSGTVQAPPAEQAGR
jgi:hypothetical protein